MNRLRIAVGATLLAAALAAAAPAGAGEPPPPPAVDLPPPTTRLAVFGDYGVDNANEAAVATLVHRRHPTAVVTTGDNRYGNRTYEAAVGTYYGDLLDRFFPSLGNHDYSDGGGLASYLAYFQLPGNERYYDVVLGPVHLFVLNANPQEPDGVSSTSAQATWLQNGLAASTSPWQVVALHHSPYSSSSSHGDTPYMQWPYAAWGADLVVSGHDHTYERIIRDDLTYVVSGLGGNTEYGFLPSPVAGSQVRYDATNGSAFFQACGDRITGQFQTSTGQVIDRFTPVAGPTAPPPSPPHGLSDVPAWANAAVSWLVDPAHPYLQAPGSGTFGADQPTTRGDATRLLYRLAGSPPPSAFPAHGFSDVDASLDAAVRWAVATGVATGFSDGTYRPGEPVARGALLRMLYRFLGSPSVAELPSAPFRDVPTWLAATARWAADPCPFAPTVAGYPDDTWRPNATVTRAQWARMVFRAVT